MADEADDPTSYRFLKVYLLWLFGWVLFCESAGDSVSRYMLPWAQKIADTPLD
jgi:quinol-cytochrome oxidoreductase complex cytochrome b subunit